MLDGIETVLFVKCVRRTDVNNVDRRVSVNLFIATINGRCLVGKVSFGEIPPLFNG